MHTNQSAVTFKALHWRCSVKKNALKNFADFTRKHLSWTLFLIKLQASRSITWLKRDSNIGVFLWNLLNLRTPVLKNICKQLLLILQEELLTSSSTIFYFKCILSVSLFSISVYPSMAMSNVSSLYMTQLARKETIFNYYQH